MPYITPEQREYLTYSVVTPRNSGELNYILTMITEGYLHKLQESYRSYNDVMGVLSCMQQELYRRKIAPYEDAKIVENGDVF